jgi:DNA-binding LytR/AlgR family response regulator
MKRILAVLMIAMIMVSCDCGEKNNKRKAPDRIKMIEQKITKNQRVILFSVDDVLYISTSDGYVIRHEVNK